MKLKMPIIFDNVSVHPKLQNLIIMQKNLNFSPQFTFNQAIHIEIKYLYMHWVLYGMKKLCHAFYIH